MFFSLQILSLYTTGELFSYHFLNYLNLNYEISILEKFLIVVALSIPISLIIYNTSKKVKSIYFYKTNYYLPILASLFILLNLQNSIFTNIIHIYYNPFDSNTKIYKNSREKVNFDIYTKDKNRFIAHAAGEINGNKYTNSFEALNLNYKNGFRLFELDILLTSDKRYVAVHNWDEWVKKTAYSGLVPPTKKIFMQYKILNKYTPMDMHKINDWFLKHKDAILVTDKINTPIDFSNQFTDKNRLIMELFTWKAVKDAIDAKIKFAMPTFGILKQIRGDKIKFLNQLKITKVAASRSKAYTDKNLIANLNNANIDIFAFHINDSKDETYVICNERKYFYGIYANTWDFNATLHCLSDEKYEK